MVNPEAIVKHTATNGEGSKDDPLPCLLFFDSLDMPLVDKPSSRANVVATKIRQWLNVEWQRSGRDAQCKDPFNEESMKLYTPKGISQLFPHLCGNRSDATVLTAACFAFAQPVPIQRNGYVAWPRSRNGFAFCSGSHYLSIWLLSFCYRCDCGVFLWRYVFAMSKLFDKTFSYRDAGLIGDQRPFEDLIEANEAFRFEQEDIARVRNELISLLIRLSVIYERNELNRRKAWSQKSKERQIVQNANQRGDIPMSRAERQIEQLTSTGSFKGADHTQEDAEQCAQRPSRSSSLVLTELSGNVARMIDTVHKGTEFELLGVCSDRAKTPYPWTCLSSFYFQSAPSISCTDGTGRRRL